MLVVSPLQSEKHVGFRQFLHLRKRSHEYHAESFDDVFRECLIRSGAKVNSGLPCRRNAIKTHEEVIARSIGGILRVDCRGTTLNMEEV